ncbi:uncharacterized protein LOC107406223 isoform X2 [Ziziphus jujuba]|uniref:Uncharacterized protein LOC107406223 isoform X2 n=1 Tax=Ziziphus jujuba TaxID=326968 RepID=A0A6P6FT65_ZIZJJ|nr:uncharacterized protein LOC107406223 isoform X2 [Ziziphus jujuba]
MMSHPQTIKFKAKARLPSLRSSSSSSNHQHESSFSSSNQASTAKTTTTRTTTTNRQPSFASKLKPGLIFSYQQHFGDQIQSQSQSKSTIPASASSCFNSSSKRWGGLKLGCLHLWFMATHADLSSSVHSPSDATIRKKKLSGQRKKEELEKEKMLSQEKVHLVLEHVQNRHIKGSALSIPNFLPPKVKELLAELAMVEGEITRLENQISQLQLGLKQEQEANKESKYRQWPHGTPYNPVSRSSHFTFPSPMNNAVHERMAFETKALHFISKAIKGDYNLSDFSLDEKKGILQRSDDQKENYFNEDKFQDKVPRKSGTLLKPASPLRDPRNPSPKPRERNLGTPMDLLPKTIPVQVNPEENFQNLHPNKLSEEIMKCLNFIYIRMLRTTRAMELEKSGPVSRSAYSSASSRSFRAETPINSKSMLQKESRQQDPYGIFNVEECIPRDIGPYKNLVIFTSSSMDPKCISSNSSIPLLRKLRALLNSLQTTDLKSLTNQQKLAFWINMYNACIMHGFLQYGVPANPEKLLTLMNRATLNIGGNIINAQAIEHYVLRKPASSNMKEAYRKGEKDDKESIVRELFGLELMDTNVTFALCCGTRSSPAVRIYTADGVVAELERSKLEYLQASIVVTGTRRIAIPELVLRHMLDFAVDRETLVEWVCHQLPTSGSLRKSMVDCFRGHSGGKMSSTIIDKIPYDFEFQYLLAV